MRYDLSATYSHDMTFISVLVHGDGLSQLFSRELSSMLCILCPLPPSTTPRRLTAHFYVPSVECIYFPNPCHFWLKKKRPRTRHPAPSVVIRNVRKFTIVFVKSIPEMALAYKQFLKCNLNIAPQVNIVTYYFCTTSKYALRYICYI